MNTKIETPRLHLRCSSLPLIMRCAAAAQKPELLIHSTNAQAELGTNVHDHLRAMVETGRVDFDTIRSPEERALTAVGWRMWKDHLRELFPSPACERALEVEVLPGLVVTGHTDVQSGMVGTCRVLDWKSGRLDSDYREQLLGYAALEMLENHAIDRVETHIAWIRDQEIENYTLTREQLPAWCERLGRVLDWNGVYEQGDHCGYCPRAHECRGFNAVVRRDAAAILDLDPEELEDALAEMPADRVIELVRRARAVERIAKRVTEAARSHVDRTGDVVGSDSLLTIQRQSKRKVDAFAAWPVLLDQLDDRELALCCDVRMTKLEEIVASKAPKRGGAAAKRELAKKLEEADAVRLSETKILKEKRV